MGNMGSFFIRETLNYLRSGFKTRWSFIIALAMLTILDTFAFAGIIWFFLLKTIFPIPAQTLTIIGGAYLACASAMALLSLFCSLNAVRALSVFYVSVGIFFLLYGEFESSGLEFKTWPWAVLWVVTILIAGSQFSKEYKPEENEALKYKGK